MHTSPTATIGSKWTPNYRPAREIAADIRRDLKAAQKAGDIPADIKISVRCQTYGGGRAIDVTLSGWNAAQVYVELYGDTHRYTTAAQQTHRTVETIREAYNRDASDALVDYYDVDYYGGTRWDLSQ